jgi:hypothetical protein
MKLVIAQFLQLLVCVALLGAGMTFGCAGRPALLPSTDPNLRKTMTEFAADAAKRHPYKSDAPRGGEALARASIEYTFKTFQILNYSDTDWQDVEIWVNQNYVVFVPAIPHGKEGSKLIEFSMLFDEKGNYFKTDGGKVHIDQLEVLRDGKMYTIKTTPAD